MIHPLRALAGYYRLSVSREDAPRLTTLCMDEHIAIFDQSFEGDRYAFSCSLPMTARLKRRLFAEAVDYSADAVFGAPALIGRYRGRWGLAVGAFLAVVLVFLSGRVVWGIRVEGNRTVSDGEVIDLLRECGLTVGMPISRINADEMANRLLIATDDISWAAVNVMGCVCQVEIREPLPMPSREEEPDAANLVASYGGRIEWMEDVRGVPTVKVGDEVTEGALLVSGLYGDGETSLRYTCAEGRIYARTERSFSVEIPLKYEKKVYTGREKVEKYLIFFEKEIKFFGNSRNFHASCDTINTEEYFELSEDTRLPFGIRTVRVREYVTEEATRSEEQAARIARDRLSCLSALTVTDGSLVSRSITEGTEGECYVLQCRAGYIENIARRQVIEVEGLRKKK